MTLFMITVIPRQHKRLELIQTLDMLLGSLKKMSPEISFFDTPRYISLRLHFVDENKMNQFLESNEFAVLEGAVRTLGTQSIMTADGAEIKNTLNKLK